MANKKLFSDKRWTQPLGGKVVGHYEVTEEDKEMVRKFKEKMNKERKTIKHFAIARCFYYAYFWARLKPCSIFMLISVRSRLRNILIEL